MHYTVQTLLLWVKGKQIYIFFPKYLLSYQKYTPVCPWSFCTISFVCKFQMYTMLSSDPDTIHYKQKLTCEKTSVLCLVSEDFASHQKFDVISKELV